MTNAISGSTVGDFATSLAELEVQLDIDGSQSAREQRDAARESYLGNVQTQIDKLHEAASAMRTGAFVNVGLQLAGSACELGAAGVQYRLETHACTSATPEWKLWGAALGKAGEVLTKVAAPLQQLVGESSQADAQAEAKRYESLAAQAQWLASDASTRMDECHKGSQKILDQVQQIWEDQSGATNAIIGRV